MKTTTLHIPAANLITDKARIIYLYDGSAKPIVIDLHGEPVLSIYAREIDLRSVGGPHVYEFSTASQTLAAWIIQRLTELEIEYQRFEERAGSRVMVKLLDLLDTHWMLFQCIDQKKLRITATDGIDYYLDFVNDGESMVAGHSLVGHDKEDGQALIDALEQMATNYEVA